MAGERIGKTYEAILKVSLDILKQKRKIDGNIFWNEVPEGVTVEPDFIIGPDKDHPQIIIMVTHSGSSKESEKKCWRNIGELCEVKTTLKPSPLAISIFFESVMKEQLKALQGTAFDPQLIVDSMPYGETLKKWVHTNEAEFSTDQEIKAVELAERCKHDAKLERCVQALADDVITTIETAQAGLNDLWIYEEAREKGIPPIAKNTFIRRGLSKLLVFEDIELALRLYRGKTVKLNEVPNYLYDIGLARKAIGKAVPSDPEIQNAVDLLSDENIREIYRSICNNPVVYQYLYQLRNEEDIKIMGQYVVDEYDCLCDENVLFSRLIELYNDPKALVSAERVGESWNPNNVWLFETIIEIIKLSTGKANGYGYAQLAADVAMPDGAARDYSIEARSFLLSPWGYLSDWTTRSGRTEIPGEVIHCVSAVLSEKLRSIGKSQIIRLSVQLLDSYIHNILEAKLCTYRDFSPLLMLMEHAGAVRFNESKQKMKTCFAEKAKLTGTAGQTTVVLEKHTIINWQSSYAGHPADKKKELSGRAVGLRYTWDEEECKFIKRPGIEKLILLIDGTWQQQHINAMINAGWDEIYYPDEIDKLKAAII